MFALLSLFAVYTGVRKAEMSQRKFESCRIDSTEIELSCCSQVIVVAAVGAQSWLPAWYKYQEENMTVVVVVVVAAFLVVIYAWRLGSCDSGG